MYIPVRFCKFILLIITSPAPIERIIFFNLNFKIKRSSTINTGIKTKYNLPTVCLFKLYIYTIYYNNNYKLAKSYSKKTYSNGVVDYYRQVDKN
jgi:hypothetical protein